MYTPLRSFLCLSMLAGLLAACGGGTTTDEGEGASNDESGAEAATAMAEKPVSDAIMVPEAVGSEVMAGALKLYPMDPSTEFDNAVIGLVKPENDQTFASGEPVPFAFNVENYTLGEQTPDAGQRGCANSGKGQHIHLILNNEPYLARYESMFTEELADGRYLGLAFLSRSYHESIKKNTTYKLFQFTVGESTREPFDVYGEYLFYSRPKGTYTGDDTKKVMLDFYLVNTNIEASGKKVRATINTADGNTAEVLITKWQPYFIEGLPMGENSITLELIDADGNPVATPYTPVTRTFTLSGAM